MSSESEIEQHVDSGSEEDQNDSSESQEVESEVESGSQEEDEESDSENEEVDSHDDIPVKEKSTSSEKEENTSDEPTIKMERWQLDIVEGYEKLYGKCFYVGFPDNKLSVTHVEKTLKELCSYEFKVHLHPRSCDPFLVELHNPEDREKAIEELRVKGQHLYLSKPRWEDAGFVLKKLIDKAKTFRGKEGKKKFTPAIKANNIFSSTVVVKNIPAEATISDVGKLFPNAVTIKHSFAREKYNTGIAVVRLPTRHDAVKATQENFKIGENSLLITFDTLPTWKNKPPKFQHRPYYAKNPFAHRPAYIKGGKRKLEHRPYHAKNPFAHRPAYIKGGKRKLEDRLNVESTSPKKEKLDSNNINIDGNRTESKENETILEKNKEETFKKELDNVKSKKHSKSMKKEVKIKKNKSTDTINNHSIAEDTVKEKKKIKKGKTEKPLKIKKSKVK